MLPANRWNDSYERRVLLGLTCDSDDYYNSEQHMNAIYLQNTKEKPLFIGFFFNTGAYQETIGGFGGLQHCLIPSQNILINRDADGNILTELVNNKK
jgi:arginine decarboxylase